MKHSSIKIEQPCEFINSEAISPLISKVQIKVCYVSDEPNRNKSIITKEVAKEMAPSLRGAPIVAYYDDETEDFEQHNRILSIKDGEISLLDGTRPYGFVDLNAKLWFQKFLDDGKNEREYLMTEGYIWTGQYKEAKKIVEDGKGQSMELDDDTLDAIWTKDDNGKPQFFIINEAIISKLCVLGDDYEPCFEGAQMQVNFSLNDSFKQEMYAMVNEMKKILQEGGTKMITTYALEIGNILWNKIYDYLYENYRSEKDYWISQFILQGVYEEDNNKFAILQCRDSLKFYRLDFTYDEENGFVPAEGELTEVATKFEPIFALADIEAYEAEFMKQKNEENQDNSDKSIEGKNKDNIEGEEPAVTYFLDEIPEYVDLKAKFEELQTSYAALETERNALETQLNPLIEFKKASEKKEKEAMIAQFYMLSDEDKKDVIDNIDNYSLDDIEAKLSILCVRNKVSFDLDENKESNKAPMTYSLCDDNDDDSMPAWVKAAIATSKKD